MKWHTSSLNPFIKIKINTQIPFLYATLKQRIETIWIQKIQKFPGLFNGRVFTVDHIDQNTILGHWTEYKSVLAQMEHPDLYKDLQIRSLAVNGLIKCPEGYVLGKRSSSSVYLPNYWQSPPAGSVESRFEEQEVDLLQQLYSEAEEELGLSIHHFLSSKIISATEHAETHIIDIGIMLETSLSFQTLYKIWSEHNNNEYDELICIQNATDIPEKTLPTTLYLLNHWQ